VRYHEDGMIYALKKIKINNSDGFPATALREISNLISLNHPNVVKIYKVFYEPERSKLEILYEYIEQDLKDFIRNHGSIKLNEIKVFFQLREYSFRRTPPSLITYILVYFVPDT